MSTFEIAQVEVPVARSSARKVDERFRPIYDAVAALEVDGGKGITVTFADADEANAAKGSVQAMAGTDFTAREVRGKRVTDEKSGKVTITLTKRPKQVRRPNGETQEVAAAE